MSRVLIVVFDGFQALDAFGPMEVFAGAGDDVALAAPQAGHITSSNGVRLSVAKSLSAVRGSIDTLIVAGGDGTKDRATRAEVARHVARLAPRCRRVASVCTGAFVVAEAGLLDGRRAVTHWHYVHTLVREYPKITVEPDALYVRDGNIWTSAGVTAGMDLALAMVEADRGTEMARLIARHLVLYLRRPGGQSQFSVMEPVLGEGRTLRELTVWIGEHLGADLSAGKLAAHAAMSERSLARAFARELSTTPAAFVEGCRIAAARGLLEATDLGAGAIATRVGFGAPETFHRAFVRVVGVTPGDYRQRFRGVHAAS